MQVNVRFVHNYEDRHGRERSYFRRDGKRIALTARPIGGLDWQKQYHAALGGAEPATGKLGVGRSEAGSVNAMIARMIASRDWQKLSPRTRRNYGPTLTFLRDKIGKGSVAVLRRRHIVDLLAQTANDGAYNMLLVTFRKVIAEAIEIELREDDPTAGIDKRLSDNPLGREFWTDAHIEQYRQRHALGTTARLALEIAYATGLRISDLCKLGRQHLSADGKSFEIMPFKTRKFGTTVTQPLRDPDLLAALATAPVRGQRAFLCTVTGRDYSVDGLGDAFVTWCREAGLPDSIRAHGLRKSCAVRLSHAGASTHEIMEWIGDKDEKMVALYTKARNTRLLSESAAEKVAAFAARRVGR
jgi:integrase